MASDIVTRSGLARHGRTVMSIILFQTLLIVWLSVWAVEDYLNNAYVRAYVDLSIQTEGWILGVLAFIGVLGSVMGLVVRRNRHASKTLDLATTEATVPISTPVTMTTPPTSSKPSVELHPAVAALKAELSERRMSLGLESVAAGPERNAGPSEGFAGQKTMMGTRSSQVIQSPMAGPSRSRLFWARFHRLLIVRYRLRSFVPCCRREVQWSLRRRRQFSGLIAGQLLSRLSRVRVVGLKCRGMLRLW